MGWWCVASLIDYHRFCDRSVSVSFCTCPKTRGAQGEQNVHIYKCHFDHSWIRVSFFEPWNFLSVWFKSRYSNCMCQFCILKINVNKSRIEPGDSNSVDCIRNRCISYIRIIHICCSFIGWIGSRKINWTVSYSTYRSCCSFPAWCDVYRRIHEFIRTSINRIAAGLTVVGCVPTPTMEISDSWIRLWRRLFEAPDVTRKNRMMTQLMAGDIRKV